MGRKGEETYQAILAAAMQSFARFGDKGTTFQSIADIAGVSQPLVAKYFRTREAVLPAVIDKFLHDARLVTVETVEKKTDPRDKLREYVRISVKMFRDRPEIFKIYLLLHYYAGFSQNYRERNTEIKRVAVDRIAKIIDEGIQQKVFKKCNSKVLAKVIHNSLVGLVLGIVTESTEFTDQQLERTLISMVFNQLSEADAEG